MQADNTFPPPDLLGRRQPDAASHEPDRRRPRARRHQNVSQQPGDWLRNSERHLRFFFDQSPDAMYVVSPGGAILEANYAWMRLFGYSPEDMLSLDVHDVYAVPSDREDFVRRIADTGFLMDTVRLKRKDGAVFDCGRRVVALKDETGALVAYQGVMYDSTEMKQAEDREERQRAFAEALMETSPACILVFDAGMRVIFANPETDRVLGIAPEQVVGMTCGEGLRLLDVSGAPVPEGQLAVCRVFVTEQPLYSTEYAFDSPTGRRILSLSAAPLLDETDSVRSVVATIEDVTARKEMEEDIRRSCDIQATLNEILRLSLVDLPLQSILERSLLRILSIPWLALESRGAIFLVEDEPAVLTMRAQVGLAESVRRACARLPFGKCLCGRAALTEETQFADRVDGRHETTCEGITSHGHYCVPIVSASKVLGVMNVYTQEGHPRADFEEAFLIAVANTLAGILERERSIERLRKALKATVEVMSAAVQMRDPYTASHQLRVTTVAGAIAGEMGVTDDSRHALQLAGQVHDLGKLRIPAEILTKPGRLTDTEFLLIKEHPQASYDLLKGIDFPGPVALIAYQHHERIDGSGYPQGLTGDEMLPEARILAVADVFEAMASHRPYRPALGVEGALHELERGRDTVYDRDAVDALIRLVRDKGFTLD